MGILSSQGFIKVDSAFSEYSQKLRVYQNPFYGQGKTESHFAKIEAIYNNKQGKTYNLQTRMLSDITSERYVLRHARNLTLLSEASFKEIKEKGYSGFIETHVKNIAQHDIESAQKSIFNIKNLKPQQHWLLTQFVCLPSDFHSFSELELLFGAEKFDQQHNKKGLFKETLNELYKNGFLQYHEETDSYSLNNAISQIVSPQLNANHETISHLLKTVTQNMTVSDERYSKADKAFEWKNIGNHIFNFLNSKGIDEENLSQDEAQFLLQFGNTNRLFYQKMKATGAFKNNQKGIDHIYDIADTCLDVALDYFKQNQTQPRALFDTYYNIARLYTHTFPEQSLENYEKALKLIPALQHKNEKMDLGISDFYAHYANALGIVSKKKASPAPLDLICQYHQYAFDIRSGHLGTYDQEMQQPYHSLAEALVSNGKFQEALDLICEAQKINKLHSDYNGEFNFLSITCLHKLDRLEEANKIVAQMILKGNFVAGPEYRLSDFSLKSLIGLLKEYDDASKEAISFVKKTANIMRSDNPSDKAISENLIKALHGFGLHEEANSMSENMLEEIQEVGRTNNASRQEIAENSGSIIESDTHAVHLNHDLRHEQTFLQKIVGLFEYVKAFLRQLF